MPSPDTGSAFGAGILFGSVIACLLCSVCFVLTLASMETKTKALNIRLEEYRQEAIDLGFASYNSKTGSWEWKQPLTVQAEKPTE